MSAAATRPRRVDGAAAGARQLPLRLAGRSASGRNPAHPGYFLHTRYLKPLGITQQALARDLGISRRRVNELIRGHRGITADTALRLAYYFRNEPSFWLQLQLAWDLRQAARRFRPLARRAAAAFDLPQRFPRPVA
ncbi:MAG: HigA family addiction module antidote protein [Burkholderiales bacterium]|nr:HigA family addiction module antidote protein [Burkholderiales bacterium]